MCLTAPVLVVDVSGAAATVEAGSLRRTVSILATPEVRPGDWALVSSGTLVRVLEPDLAAELEAALRTATGVDS